MAQEDRAVTHAVSGVHGPFRSRRVHFWADFESGSGVGRADLQIQVGNDSSTDWMTIYTTTAHMPAAETVDTLNMHNLNFYNHQWTVTVTSGSIKTFLLNAPIE